MPPAVYRDIMQNMAKSTKIMSLETLWSKKTNNILLINLNVFPSPNFNGQFNCRAWESVPIDRFPSGSE